MCSRKKIKHLCAVCLTLIHHLGSSVKAEGIWKGHSEYPVNDEPYNSMIFEQLGRIEESGGMERNEKSYNSLNAVHKAGPGGIEDSGDMERNDEFYNSMIFEQPGRIEESDGMERNDKPLLKRAKVVRPVHAKRTYHASHHEGHTSLRSSGWWANNWPRTRRSAVLHKSQLRQKYPTTTWKYATKGYK